MHFLSIVARLLSLLSLALVVLPAGAIEWISDQAGCRHGNPNPQANESIRWTGGCRDGLADGEGELQWFLNGESDSIYRGSVRGGLLNGRGIYRYKSGNVYEGDFVDGSRSGQGVLTIPGRGRYEGEFTNGKMGPKGTFFFSNGDRYTGAFIQGEQTGQGVYHYADGEWYVGEFNNGQIQGRGAFHAKDGSQLVGTFVQGKIHDGQRLGPDGAVIYTARGGKRVDATEASAAPSSPSAGQASAPTTSFSTAALPGRSGDAGAGASTSRAPRSPAAETTSCSTVYVRPEPNGFTPYTPPGVPSTGPQREWPMEKFFGLITEGQPFFFRDQNMNGDELAALRGRAWQHWAPQEWDLIMAAMEKAYKPFGRDRRLDFEVTRIAFDRNLQAFQCYKAAAQKGATVTASSSGRNASPPAQPSQPTSGNTAQADAERLAGERARQADAMAQHAEQADAEAAGKDRSDPRWRFEYLPSHHRCLRVVDVRADGTVKGMYWYSLQNVCDQPLQALWCEKSNQQCAQGHLAYAARLEPQEKATHLWERRQDNRPPQFSGFACAVEYNGRATSFDFKKRRCRGWAAPL